MWTTKDIFIDIEDAYMKGFIALEPSYGCEKAKTICDKWRKEITEFIGTAPFNPYDLARRIDDRSRCYEWDYDFEGELAYLIRLNAKYSLSL